MQEYDIMFCLVHQLSEILLKALGCHTDAAGMGMIDCFMCEHDKIYEVGE